MHGRMVAIQCITLRSLIAAVWSVYLLWICLLMKICIYIFVSQCKYFILWLVSVTDRTMSGWWFHVSFGLNKRTIMIIALQELVADVSWSCKTIVVRVNVFQNHGYHLSLFQLLLVGVDTGMMMTMFMGVGIVRSLPSKGKIANNVIISLKSI